MRTKFISLLLTGLLCLSGLAFAQTSTTGDVSGNVMDSTGAVVPGATVTIKDRATQETRTVTSNASGGYRFNLVKPGEYTISAATASLKSDTIAGLVVKVGVVVTQDITVKVKATTETVVVEATEPLLQTDNANVSSSFTGKQLNTLPAPGGDITTIAFTVPGVNLSTGGGYGNFSANGMPGTSNLFTTNGQDNMDPYLNLNNSGASNLTLGANEVDQASVVLNGYSGQFGRQAGAVLNYSTKSGSNAFHGNLLYNYNDAAFNANDFFNNASGTPKGRAISNQYAASIGGPVKKDKLFFYADTESLRYTLPSAGVVSIPSAALQKYSLATIPAADVPFYQAMFNLYNNAPGSNRKVAVTNGDGLLQDSNGALGCGGLAGTPTTGGTFGVNVSCADAFGTNNSNQNVEWLMVNRMDYNWSDKQRLYGRFKMDHGLQPTETSAINPVFNAVSSQPEYEGQFVHTYTPNAKIVNQFIGSSSYYSAIFSPADVPAALALLPHELNVFDGGANGTGQISQVGMTTTTFPQGRRVGQLQLTDDFSYTLGRHSIKAGVNYRYNRITDTGNQRLVAGGNFSINALDEFASGVLNGQNGSLYQHRYTPFSSVHLRLYNVGTYIQDEWAAAPGVKVTLAVRFDRTGNPNCVDNCFARLLGPFETIAHSTTTPYNQSIQTGLSDAFPSVEAVVVQPRIGIAYTPTWRKGMVIRGGIGLFSDQAPGFLASGIFGNTPNVYTPSVLFGNIAAGGAGSAPAIADATGRAFQSSYANGATLSQLQSTLGALLGVPASSAFTAPGYTSVANEIKSAKYAKWSFEVQQEVFSPKNVFTVSYTGNHGYDIFNRNLKLNGSSPTGFGGLPTTAPDPRFRVITGIDNSGYSNYEGLSVSFRRGFGYGFQGQIGYTWSHALDTVSNGGLTEIFSGDSLTSQMIPGNVGANYSNADYDIRHSLVSDFTWDLPYKFQNRVAHNVLANWSLATKFFVRSGTPFSVIDSRLVGRAPTSVSTGGNVLAWLRNSSVNTTCGSANVDKPCFATSDFDTVAQQTARNTWGNIPRNFFRAPGFANVEMAVYKTIPVREQMKFQLGAQFYNLFNHANFASPGSNVAVGGLGLITSTVTTPASPYGSFQGSAVSGRVVVFTGKFSF